MDSNKCVEHVTFKQKYGLKPVVISPSSYLRRLLYKAKNGEFSKVIIDQDIITLNSGHKFKFKPIETKDIKENGFGYFSRLDVRNLLKIYSDDVTRLFLVRYPLVSVGDMIEIEITHFIKPDLNKLDFLRRAFNSGEVVGNELLQLLTAKARRELSKIHVGYKVDSSQVLDIKQEDLAKPLTIEFIRVNYNLETAKDFANWIHTIYHNNILRNAHDIDLTLKEKIISAEMIIKSLTKYRRAVKELKLKL